MKGIVFTEFLQLVEEKFGYEMVDKLLVAANLEHGGAYTAVGTYGHQELITLVSKLSDETRASSLQSWTTPSNSYSKSKVTFMSKFASFTPKPNCRRSNTKRQTTTPWR